MTILYQIPALLRITIVFVLMLMAIRKKKLSLGNAFVLGAIALGIFFEESL
jgi:hypothetical protein